MLATLSATGAFHFTPVNAHPSIQAIAFQRQGCLFAVPLSAVREMTTAGEVTRCESVASERKSSCSLGGTALPVIDLVEHDSVAIEETSLRILVVSHQSQRIGIIYDMVIEICQIQPTLIAKTAPFESGTKWPIFDLDLRRVAYLEPAHLIDSLEPAAGESLACVAAFELVG